MANPSNERTSSGLRLPSTAPAKRWAAGEGRDINHSVTNPIARLTGAIHVYGADFFDLPRSEWDPERLAEQPGDVQKTLRLFEESNRLYTYRKAE